MDLTNLRITIDSMIWIYYFDPNSVENENVKTWMNSDPDALKTSKEIVLNTIIPLEVLHTIGRRTELDYSTAYNAMMSLTSLDKVTLHQFDFDSLKITLDYFSEYRFRGIGARDTSIISLLLNDHSDVIVTNDKNILRIKEINRINPTVNPFLYLEVDEEYIS